MSQHPADRRRGRASTTAPGRRCVAVRDHVSDRDRVTEASPRSSPGTARTWLAGGAIAVVLAGGLGGVTLAAAADGGGGGGGDGFGIAAHRGDGRGR